MRSLVVLVLLAACHPPGYGKDVPAPDAGGPDAGSVPDGADAPDAAPAECQAAFRLEGYGGASTVWLTGDFIAWAGTSPPAIALALDAGTWTATHTLPSGSHHYKFIVDGSSWIADPGNPNGVDDGFGGTNSVYVCSP